MKKIILIILLAFVIPQISLASWWSPTTWFSNWSFFKKVDTKTEVLEKRIQGSESKLLTSTTSPEYTTFYIKYDKSRVRKCASTVECDVLGYYQKNQEINISGSNLTLNDLQEWITMNYTSGPIGYIHKSVLSNTPISHEEIRKANAPTIDRSIVSGWVADMDSEIQLTSDMVYEIQSTGNSVKALDAMDVIDVYKTNINVLRSQLVTYTSNNDFTGVKSTLDRYSKMKNQFEYDLKLALATSIQRTQAGVSNARIEAVSAAYRQAQAEQDAINQARMDATNAYVTKYNQILETAKKEGGTEAGFNAQLNAAGLIKSTTCSFSAVGGMTPGAGSMTCY